VCCTADTGAARKRRHYESIVPTDKPVGAAHVRRTTPALPSHGLHARLQLFVMGAASLENGEVVIRPEIVRGAKPRPFICQYGSIHDVQVASVLPRTLDRR
jgi:hypothetical protein